MISSNTCTRIVCATLFASLSLVPRLEIAAQSTMLNFEMLTESAEGSGTRFISNCFVENGFVFTAVGVPCSGPASQNAFLASGPNSPLFSGGSSISLVLNTESATAIDLMRSGGGLFDLNSLALSGFFGAEETSVLLSGLKMSGSAARTVMVGFGFETFNFSNDFRNLTSLRISAMNEFGEPFVNIDNIQLAVANVPEPSSFALLFAGVAALFVVARRRQNA